MWAITVALLCAAIFVLGIAFWVYYRDIVTEELSPNRWSWLIWTIEMWMQAVTYEGLNNDLVKSAAIFVAAIGCTAVFVRTWQRAAWKKPNPTETVCVLMSVAALVVWVGFGSVFWAHYLVVGAVPIAFLPTWQNAWRHPREERSSAWVLWTTADVLTLAVIMVRFDEINELPYIIVEIVCHAIVAIIVWRRLT